MNEFESKLQSLRQKEWMLYFDFHKKNIEVSTLKKHMKEIKDSSLLAYFKHTHGYQIQYGFTEKEPEPKKTEKAKQIERPDWVKWEARDKTGEKWGYSHKPEPEDKNGWYKIDPAQHPDEDVKTIMYGLSDDWCKNWKDTLEKVS